MSIMTFGDLEQLASRHLLGRGRIPDQPRRRGLEDRPHLQARAVGREGRPGQDDHFSADPLHVSCLFVDYVLDALCAEPHD